MGFLSSFRKRSADDPPPTEEWPLFAFGKLPVYKDFISAGITDDVSREFRDWMSDGFSKHWAARDEFRGADIPFHAFLLRLAGSRRTAAGAFWGSCDQGGLRKFPFAIFTIVPGGKAASVLTALDFLPAFEARARELKRKYDEGGTLAAVYQELRGAKITVPVRKDDEVVARLADALKEPRVGALAKSLFGDDAAPRWTALLTSLDAAARRPSAGAAAYRLPLAREIPPLDQLKLWSVRLGHATGTAPAGVLYRTDGPAPAGVVFFRDARPEDLLLAHPDALPADFVEEIPAGLRNAVVAQPTAPEEDGVLRLGAAAAQVPVPPPALVEVLSSAPVAPPEPPAPPSPPPSPEPEVGARPSSELPPAEDAAARGDLPAPETPPDGPAPKTVPASATDSADSASGAGSPAEPEAAAVPAADAPSPAPSTPVPAPVAEPAGWDLPLSSLLPSP